MSASYLIDQPRSIVFSRAWGILTDDELRWHAETLQADARFDPGFRQAADFRDVVEMRVTPEGVRSLAHVNPFRRDSRRAIIVPTDLTFGFVRMFEALTQSDPEQFRVFRLMGPAFEWVGLDPAMPWPVEEPNATIGASQ